MDERGQAEEGGEGELVRGREEPFVPSGAHKVVLRYSLERVEVDRSTKDTEYDATTEVGPEVPSTRSTHGQGHGLRGSRERQSNGSVIEVSDR